MTEPIANDNTVFEQIASLALTGEPLIVCDVDEVILEFISPLERFMSAAGFELVDHHYQLNGNIRRIDGTGHATQDEIHALIYSFFEKLDGHQNPIEGAVETLTALAERAQIVLLTNIPDRYRADRISILRGHGIPFPVITNMGPKGPAVAALARQTAGPVIFLDDSPTNVVSVRDTVSHARIVHFIGDKRFFARAVPIEGMHLTTCDWAATRDFITATLAESQDI